ncbi:integrin beta-1-binding protein 2 isoform X3 [Arvicanthis niloticus]|uniref:integrin beta-1-binding protein 2 isoform X3 n=1 Tax=Arvicanthis niloticus TaxID=61156 RepID=UPI00402BEE9B
MSLLCYNKGCGQHFDPNTNLPDSCRYHPGVPIFHDALKGWSCCRKRTVDFSEFLNIKGCTVGPHCAEKLPEVPPQPEGSATSSLQEQKALNTIPKSAETLLRERPKSEMPPKLLPLLISQALGVALEQKELDQEPGAGLDNSLIWTGSSCQNPGCDAVYQGPESDATPCTYHPGAPRFHEGMKSWSCCGIQTLDFGAFLAQPGCRVGRHDWAKQLPASCRHDWHQTDSLVVLTVYGQIPLPAFNWVKASQTEGNNNCPEILKRKKVRIKNSSKENHRKLQLKTMQKSTDHGKSIPNRYIYLYHSSVSVAQGPSRKKKRQKIVRG